MRWNVRADDKKFASLNLTRHILAQVERPDKDAHQAAPDAAVVFPFDREQLRSGAIAP